MTENFNLEKLILKTSKGANSATTQAVASYVMYIVAHDSVNDLREFLKKNGIYNTSNRGAVNKNITTARAIVGNMTLPKYESSVEGFKVLCKFIENNHLTYACFKETLKKKKSEEEKEQARIESIIKQIQSLSDESFEVLQISLSELGFTLTLDTSKENVA